MPIGDGDWLPCLVTFHVDECKHPMHPHMHISHAIPKTQNILSPLYQKQNTKYITIKLLKGHKCLIWDTWRTLIGQIPLLNGLYKVECKPTAPTMNVAWRLLTLDELHCHIGHISPQTAWKLVWDGTIMGLDVDMSSQSSFCMACAQAKPMCKSVPQKWEGPQVTKVSEKVHSDVWGPANPQSYNGKEYFVSFTDDHNWWMYSRQQNCSNVWEFWILHCIYTLI